MTRYAVAAVAALVLCACVRHAGAMGELIEVTKDTQAKQGLAFTFVADKVDEEAILCRIVVPRTGKLKGLRSISLRIGSGRPLVYAPLQTTVGKDGAWTVNFQVSPTLADKCYVDLTGPYEGLSYTVYAVELKGYVTARK